MRAVFAPKVAGAAALHSHMHTTPLQNAAVFSSVAGALGSSGQANYAAANATLDAWAASSQLQVHFLLGCKTFWFMIRFHAICT